MTGFKNFTIHAPCELPQIRPHCREAFCGDIYHAKIKLKKLGEYCKILHTLFDQ